MKLNRKRDLNRCGIYAITNLTNNKVYVGKSINIYERIRQHINKLNKSSKESNLHLNKSWKKYGRDSFKYEVLEDIEKDDNLLKEAELKWMLKLNTTNREFGYNLRLDTETNCILPEETRKRMSDSKKKMYADPNYDNMKHSHTYWKDNPEAKKQMAERVSKKATRYKIHQFDVNMNFIKEWNSVKEICDKNEGYKWQNIYAVCNGYKPTIYNFIWRKIKI